MSVEHIADCVTVPVTRPGLRDVSRQSAHFWPKLTWTLRQAGQNVLTSVQPQPTVTSLIIQPFSSFGGLDCNFFLTFWNSKLESWLREASPTRWGWRLRSRSTFSSWGRWLSTWYFLKISLTNFFNRTCSALIPRYLATFKVWNEAL